MAYRKAPLPMLQALACAVLGPCAGHVPDGIIWPKPIKGAYDMSIVEHILMTICTGAVMIGGVAFSSEQAEQQDGHRHDVQDE